MIYAALLRDVVTYANADKSVEIILKEDLFKSIVQAAVLTIKVDEKWYVNKYEDIKKSVEKGLIGSGKEHYHKYGYFEHRQPYLIGVDEEYYLQNNPDVASAIEAGILKNAQEHFDGLGFREGRAPFRDFSLFGSAGFRAK